MLLHVSRPHFAMLSVALLLVACGGSVSQSSTGSAASVGENRFASETLGFAIEKPSGWHFETAQLAERENTKSGADTYGALQRKYEHEPFITLLKYESTGTKLNPSVKVTLRPLAELKGKPLTEIATMVAKGMKQTIPTFKLDEPVKEATLADRPAGFLRARFTVQDRGTGTTYHVRTRFWLVPRKDRLFIIGMSAPSEGDDTCESEFTAIGESIQIADVDDRV